MQPTIGDHVARIRRQRGFTQEQLAEAAGVSVETIRKLEQRERTSARMSTLAKLARALRVSTSALMGDATRAAARREPEWTLGLLDVRRALTPAQGIGGQLVDDVEQDLPTLTGTQASIAVAHRLYHANDYAGLLTALPGLLGEVRQLVDAHEGDDQLVAYALTSQAYRITGKLLLQLRAEDLAYTALDRSLDAARRSGQDLTGAATVHTLCWLLTRQGRFSDTARLAVDTADRVEPGFRSSSAALSTWGWLLIDGAAAAARDNRDDDAVSMLDLAAAAAVRVDATPDAAAEHLVDGFSSAKVAMMRVECAAVAHDAGRALALASDVHLTGREATSCRLRHRLDVAWSHVAMGQYGDATTELLAVRQQAPAWIRHQRYAREIVATIATERRRAMSRELADLAALVGAGA